MRTRNDVHTAVSCSMIAVSPLCHTTWPCTWSSPVWTCPARCYRASTRLNLVYLLPCLVIGCEAQFDTSTLWQSQLRLSTLSWKSFLRSTHARSTHARRGDSQCKGWDGKGGSGEDVRFWNEHFPWWPQWRQKQTLVFVLNEACLFGKFQRS